MPGQVKYDIPQNLGLCRRQGRGISGSINATTNQNSHVRATRIQIRQVGTAAFN